MSVRFSSSTRPFPLGCPGVDNNLMTCDAAVNCSIMTLLKADPLSDCIRCGVPCLASTSKVSAERLQRRHTDHASKELLQQFWKSAR